MPPATHRAQPTNAAPARAADTSPDAPLLTEVLERTAARLDRITGQCRKELDGAAEESLKRSLITAGAIRILGDAVEPIMPQMMDLMNTSLGFKTDRPSKGDPTPYDRDTVKRCLVEGLLRGARLHGNEINILFGSFYPTLEYYRRRCHEFPGIEGTPNVVPGTPYLKEGMTLARVSGTWRLAGRDYCLYGADGQPGRVYAVSSKGTAENLSGKFARKAYRDILGKLLGRPVVDVDPPEPTARRRTPVTAPAALDPPAGAEVPPAAPPREPGVEPEGT